MQCNLSLQIDPCKIRKILHDNIYTGSGWVEVEMELGVELELGNCFIACIFIRRLLYLRPVAAFSRKSSLFYLLWRRAARQAALQQQSV